MKKLLILLSILMLCSVGASAQTYTYKYLFSVEKDTGVKKKHFKEGHKRYITFTNGKSFCYNSDQNGVKKAQTSFGFLPIEGANEYHYDSNNNGIRLYKCITRSYTISAYGNKQIVTETVYYYNFSSDYERLNEQSPDWDLVHVFERIDNKQPETPTTLW